MNKNLMIVIAALLVIFGNIVNIIKEVNLHNE